MDLIPVELQPFVGVVALAVFYLWVAHLIQRYRQWQAEKMAKAERLMRGAERIGGIFERLAGLPVPRELVQIFTAEQLARYRGVQALFPRLEGLAEGLAEAQVRTRVASDPGWKPPVLNDRTQMLRLIDGLTRLVDVLQNEHLEEPLEPQRARQLRDRIRVLRAAARWENSQRLVQAAAARGDWAQAQDEAQKLVAFLERRAPRTDQGKAIHGEALALLKQVLQRQLPAPADVAPKAKAS